MIKICLTLGFIVILSCYVNDVSCGTNLVSQKCLGCICEAISGCNMTLGCQGDVCGVFRITWGYWSDGGKQVSKKPHDENSAYATCANDAYCAALSVEGYMQKYQQDCNGDGRIDCDDFAAIHSLGGYGCRGYVPDYFSQRYAQCKAFLGNLNE